MVDLVEIIRGVSYKKRQSSYESAEGLVPILRATNINGMLTFDGLVYVPKLCVSDQQLLRPGDVVIAASSGSREVVGKAAQLTQPWQGSFGAFCMGIRPTPEIDPLFLGYFLQSQEYRHRISSLAAGVNINNLRRQHIETLDFRLAPYAEQRRIVQKIEELFTKLDAGVAALERIQAALKRYRAAVLKAAVEGKLTAQWRARHPAKESGVELLRRILDERHRKWELQQRAKYAKDGRQPPKGWQAKYKEPAEPNTSELPALPADWCWATLDMISSVQGGYHQRSEAPSNGDDAGGSLPSCRQRTARLP